MPISKRTLTKWRKEALKNGPIFTGKPGSYNKVRDGLNARILLLTQELLDQQLLKEKIKC